MINLGQAAGYLDLDTSNFTSGINSAIKDLKTLNDASLTASGKLKTLGSAFTSAGKSLTKNLTVPIAAIGAASVAASVSFESAFAGVRKTVDATEEQFAELEQQIKDLSEKMPQSASAIAEVAEAAGQLGIATENIIGFTKTMVQLGDATNMTSTEAATALARLANITGMSQDEFDKLGSTIVELGNNLATTESEIVDMGLNIAAAGAQVGLTESEILGFAGALSSVGLETAAGGTAISKVMVEMQLAVETGGDALQNFATVANMSISDFSTLFKQDASSAIIAFIEGLGDMERLGKSSIAVLDEMGISEVRLRDSLLRAANSSELFAESIELGNSAWEQNTALTEEATKRYETTESKLLILKNQLVNVGITLGDIVVPMLTKLVEVISSFVNWLSELNTGTQETIVKVALVIAAIGPLLIIIGKMSTGVGLVINVCSSLSAVVAKIIPQIGAWIVSTNGMTVAQRALNLVMNANPIVLVTTLVAGLAAALIYCSSKTNAQEKAQKELNESIDESIEKYNSSIESIDDSSNSMEANTRIAEQLTDQLYDMAEQEALTAAEKENMKSIVNQLNDLIPNLSLSINEETGQLNMQRNEVNSLINSYYQLAIAKAYSQKIEAEAVRMVEAEEKLVQAQTILQEKTADANKVTGSAIIDFKNLREQSEAQETVNKLNEEISSAKTNMASYQNKYTEVMVEVNKISEETKNNVVSDNNSTAGSYTKLVNTKKQTDSESTSSAKKAADEQEKIREESLKAEKERIDELTKLNQDYYDSFKQINDKLQEDVQTLTQEYNQAVKSRAEEIKSSVSLFEEFNGESEKSGRQLLSNLKSQVKGLEEWRKNLDKLSEKGINEDLLQELQEMGPTAAGEIESLTKLTSKQLEDYSNLWLEKNKLIEEQAKLELQPLEEDLNRQIEELKTDANTQVLELTNTYIAGLDELGIKVNTTSEEVGIEMVKAIELGVEETEEELLAKLQDLKTQVQQIVSSINSSVESVNSVAGSLPSEGSFAGGLDYVPHDGFTATLHEGERVLTKQENTQYDNKTGANNKSILEVNFKGTLGQVVRTFKPEFSYQEEREGVVY